MGLRDVIAKTLLGKDYKLGTNTSVGGIRFSEMSIPPGWSYQSYLKAYGEIGWLFAVVNVIAQAVAKVPWHLYGVDSEGERTEAAENDLVSLLDKMNPSQSWYQFIYLGTMYKLLVGEEFWQMNFAGAKPAEIWLAPPTYMSVIPSPTKYIDHYEFKRTGMAQPVSFTVDEIIHIKTPNPYNEYRGLSPAQALTVDLDSERYASRYQQKLFYNDATPGFMIEYPAEGMPPMEARKELMQEWDERYRGFRNRGKTAFLWGGKANTITMTNRDMDFENLRKFNRDSILGAYHVPRSIIGITEDVNRANAEAAQYTFAQYVVHPELCDLREAMNKELVPFFGPNLELDFENPIPEDVIANTNNAVNLFKAGIIKRNEARIFTDFEPLDTPDGEEFFTQPSPFAGLGNLEPPTQLSRQLKSVLETEEQKEGFWKDYVSRAESYEAKTINELQAMYLEQKEEALANLNSGKKENLIDLSLAKKNYTERITPILTQVISIAEKNGQELIHPVTPHKQEIPFSASAMALRWLKSRIGWAANEIGEETASRLSQVLATGFAEGMSTQQIADLISGEFDYFSSVRAERIARTEIMQASSQGAIEGYRDTGVEDVEFYCALDERTCPDCYGLHQEVFSIPDSEGIITVHPNCRCVWLPVIE